ncbi:MAG: 4-carboxymuconolactone decarboxylase [Halieaceae bacterium]|jgi:4-carboxymuconolactone decarboxylase
MTLPNEKPRIEPLLPPDWDDEIVDALGAFPHGLRFVQSRWDEGGKDARGMHLLGGLAHYPALAKAFLTFNCHVAANSTLETREREILILRLAWLRKAEYEYYQHVVLGLRAGLTEDEMEQIRVGSSATGWSSEDADLVRVSEELCADAEVAEDTWARLSMRYNQQQMMDMVFLVGCYDVIAMTSKSFGTTSEPDTGSLPSDIRARMFEENS